MTQHPSTASALATHPSPGISATVPYPGRFRTWRFTMLAVCALALLALATSNAPAATRYWDGGTSDIAGNGNSGSAGGAGIWDTTIKNWDAGASPHVAWVNAAGDAPSFGGTAATVTLGANITVGGTININSGTAASPYTIAGGGFTLTIPAAATNGGSGYGVISAALSGGTTSLTKLGASTYVLSGTTAFGTGTTTISEGVLKITGSAALGSGNLNLAGGVLGLTANFSLAKGTAANQVKWTGSGGFAAYGADRIVSSFGTCQWNASSFVPSGSALILGAADADSTVIWQSSINLAGSTRTITVNDGPAAVDARITGQIGVSGGANGQFTKDGDGTLQLTANNVYVASSAVTTISAGTLELGNNGASGSLSAITKSISVSSGATLSVNRNNTFTQATDINGQLIIGDGGFAQVGSGTTTLSLANTYGGNTTISAGTLKLGAANAIPAGVGKGNVSVANGATLDTDTFSASINGLSGAGTVDKTGAGSATLTVGDNDQSSTFNGTIQNTAGTLSLAKTGSGTLTLGGANTFTGSATINNGTLALDNLDALQNASGITIAAGATLQPNLANTVIDAGITVGPVDTTATITAPSEDGSGTTAVPLTLNGAISGAGDLTLLGVNTGNAYSTIILNAQSSYGGSTLLNTTTASLNTEIFVRLGTNNALPTTTVLTLDGGNGTGSAPGRYCELNLTGFDQTLAGLANIARSSRLQRIVNSSATGATLTVSNSADYTYSGQLGWTSGFGSAAYRNFGLTKTGAGTQTLSGANTYTGDTTISAGTLTLSGGGSIDNSPLITVAGGATLDVSGLSAPPFALGASQALANSGATTANLVGDVSTGSGAVALAYASGTPSLSTSGTLTLSSGTTFTVNNTGTQLAHGSYKLVAKTGGGAVTGTLPSVSVTGGGAAAPVVLQMVGGELYLVVNNPPVAKAIATGVTQGDSQTVLIIGGKYNPTDADTDTLTVSAVQNPSANGAAVSTDNSSVTVDYSGVPSFTGADTFTYTVSDGNGGTDTKTITVTVSAATGGANINGDTLNVTGGVATMQAFGIPAAYYHLQYTESLTPPSWQDVGDGDVQAAANGSLSLTDSGASGPTRYYRTRYVSGP